MSKGRKPSPESCKKILGTFRPDRVVANRPDASLEGMKAPVWLPRDAVEHFGVLKSRLEASGLNSETFTETLAVAALRMSEIERLTNIIEEDGPIYESKDSDGKMLKKSHPAVSQRSEAMRHLQSALAEFGLTPAAIQKVGGAQQKPKENPFSRFGNNG